VFLTAATFLTMEQQMNNNFCFKLGKMPVETYEMLQIVCGYEALSHSSIYEWFKRFEEGHEDLQNDPTSGCPSVSRNADTISNVCEMVTRDRRWALRMMTDELNINKETIHQIIYEDLQKRKICAKLIAHTLTDKQTQRRLTSCQGFIQAC
jgi:transposase